MGALWRVELLGGLRASQGDRCISRFRTRKTAVLLGYLVHFCHRSHGREELIELFWPSCSPDSGRNQLRMALTSLRHQFEPPGVPAGAVIAADRLTVQVNPTACTTDVAQFENALRDAARETTYSAKEQRLEAAVDLYRGELLPGYFDDWIISERLRLSEAYLLALDQLAAFAETAGDLHGAIEWARRSVRADPLREDAYHSLIRLLAAVGHADAAVEQYRELDRLLLAACGAAPSDEIRSFVLDLVRETDAKTKCFVPAIGRSNPFQSGVDARLLLTGTVTFLICNFEIGLALPRGERVQPLAARDVCSDLLRRVFRLHRGHQLQDTGGRLRWAFGRASEAAAAAVAAQRAVATQPWPDDAGTPHLRMALHVGEVDPAEEIQRAAALSHALRLLWAAHPGQILLSEESARLLGRALPPHVALADLGRYRLGKDELAERIFQLYDPGLVPREFPPPNAQPGLEAHLPSPHHRFIGQAREIEQLGQLLLGAEERLVTLSGAGGSGKTRLALEVAARQQDAFRSAVWFVPLADLTDASGIVAQVLDVLRLPGSPHLPPMEQLIAALSQQRSLLVLDNFEHLLPDGASLVQTILKQAPALTMLITSRQRLGLSDEREFAVRLLSYPEAPASPEHLLEYDSVRLFVDRAQLALPDFQVTPANAAAVASLCRHLEGLPLALELAAARANVLTPQQMLTRLSDRFELLTARKRDAPLRHRSLRLALEWSYQLLSSEVRQFFNRLSVFRGGCTLAAAAAVTRVSPEKAKEASGADDEVQALEYLTQLRERSLLIAEESGDEMWFRLLETVREFGAEQLSTEEQAVLERRHAEYFLALAEAAEPHLRSMDQEAWIGRLSQEYANLRAALRWGLAEPEEGGAEASGGAVPGEVGARLAGALWWFWHFRCDWTEGRAWLDQAMGRLCERPPKGAGHDVERVRAKVLRAAGHLAWHQGDLAKAEGWLEESRGIWRKLGDKVGFAYSTMFLGVVANFQGDRARAVCLLRWSVNAFEELDDPWARGQSRYFLGLALLDLDDQMSARALIEEGLAIFRQLGDRWRIAWGVIHLGQVAHQQGDWALAGSLYWEGMAMCRALGNKWIVAHSLTRLARLACEEQDYAAARPLAEEAVLLSKEIGYKGMIAPSLCLLAEVAQYQGDYSAARSQFQEALARFRERADEVGVRQCQKGLAEIARMTGTRA